MKNQEQKITIDEFSDFVSLNNIIAGDTAVIKLKKIASSLEFDQFNNLTRFPALLVAGQAEGKTILGMKRVNYCKI